jgi:hypothetical protein
MNQAATDLLLAGLRLRNQHTAETFQQVSETLQRRNQDPYLIDLFDMLRELHELETSPKKAVQRKLTSSLNEVEARDPERHVLLRELQEMLTSKKIFAKKQPLLDFVSRKIPHVNKSKTIAKIAEQYLEALLDASLEEIAAELQLLKDSGLANPKFQKEVDSFLRMADRIVESK